MEENTMKDIQISQSVKIIMMSDVRVGDRFRKSKLGAMYIVTGFDEKFMEYRNISTGKEHEIDYKKAFSKNVILIDHVKP